MKKRDWLIIVSLAALKFVLPFLLQHPVYELHRDEYLYFEQGHHLDFGYLENPSLIGVMASFSSLLGGSFFWIKFWPALLGALTIIVTAGIAKELGGKLFACVVAALGILFSAYMRIHFLFQPNSLEIFFWTLAAYFLLRFVNTQHSKYLYLLSIALAFGWWSKYSALFFIIAILLSLLLTPYRKIFLQKHFWLALILGIALILPNIIWQYMHNWPLVHHMDELKATQLQYINKGDFIKDQFLQLFPVAFVWIGGLIWLLLHPKYRIIAYVFLTTVLLIMTGSGKAYYTLGAYPMLVAAGGVWLQRISINRVWLRWASVAIILLLALPLVPLLLPIQPPQQMAISNKEYKLEKLGILKWEDLKIHPLQQDFADMLGWKELTSKAEAFFHSLPDTVKSNTVVYCRSYGQASALRYHASDDYFRNKIISDNGTYLLWIPDHLHFQNLLFVGHKMPDNDDAVFQQFSKVTKIDSVRNPLSRQYGDEIILFENASDSAWLLANYGLKEMKAEFGQ
jgi:4-amino-4-deoxy-L-arabinose transferase-like glycosyltransferase